MRSVFLVAVVAVLTCAACSGSSSSSGSGPTIAQACAENASARCTRIQSCSAIRLAQLYGDLATCEAQVQSTCTSSLNAPQNGNNPALVESCDQAIGGWDCNDFLVGGNPPAACVQRTGPVANGGACSAPGQCQSGFCAFSTGACGACQAAPSAGQPCTGTLQCASGLECAGGTCAAPVASGGACSATQPCAPALGCSKGTCQSLASTAVSGAACGTVGGQLVGCTEGTCGKAVCVARAADGQACDETNGPFCVPGAYCISGTCQQPACP